MRFKMDYLPRVFRWLIGRDPALDRDTALNIDMDHLCSPRESTVEELARMLKKWTFIHIRGTPASGKTTLARLLKKHYQAQNIPVILFSGWLEQPDDYRVKIVQEARQLGYNQFDYDFVMDGQYALILDEGQQTYLDIGLWLDLIKYQSGRNFGPMICVFTCYGSPTAGPDSMNTSGSPLAWLGPAQRVSITPSAIKHSPNIALFYSRTEFDDVVRRYCSQEDENPRLNLDTTAQDYLFNLTNGHPGAVRGMLDMLLQVYRQELKYDRVTLSDTHVISSLDDEREAFDFLRQSSLGRSFPSQKVVSPEAASILRKVLADGNVDRDLGNEGIKQCYHAGWLHSEPVDFDAFHIVCVFPTRLHAKFVEHYWTRSTIPFPLEKYPNITDLAQAMLKRFSPRNLSNGTRVGDAAIIKPWEATYQDEFYRAAHQVLGRALNITSEWSTGGKGRIDFQLGQVGWGFELIQEGDRLKEHCERFVMNGSYARWIREGWIKDWLIIDC